MACKLKYCILLCVCSVLLMSHNSFAVDSVWDMSGYTPRNFGMRYNMNCNFNGVTQSNVGVCSASGNTNVYSVWTQENISVLKGDIVELDLVFIQPTGLSFETPQISLINLQMPSNTYRVLGFKDVSSFYSSDYSSLNINDGTISGGAFINKVMRFTFYALSDYNGPFGFATSDANYPLFVLNGTFKLKFINGVGYRLSEGTQENKEQAQATQNASDQSEQDGASSQSSAEGASQSLLTATGSVITALTNAPATDCNINLTTTGSSSSFTSAIGSLNLCSNVPSGILSFVQGLLALVLTPIVFYYCYHIVQYMINLFREYQN